MIKIRGGPKSLPFKLPDILIVLHSQDRINLGNQSSIGFDVSTVFRFDLFGDLRKRPFAFLAEVADAFILYRPKLFFMLGDPLLIAFSNLTQIHGTLHSSAQLSQLHPPDHSRYTLRSNHGRVAALLFRLIRRREKRIEFRHLNACAIDVPCGYVVGIGMPAGQPPCLFIDGKIVGFS